MSKLASDGEPLNPYRRSAAEWSHRLAELFEKFRVVWPLLMSPSRISSFWASRCQALAVAIKDSTVAFAQTAQYGTAEEARVMLEKAVAAVKADKGKALDNFNRGEKGFKDRDLYAFCANASDGIETAHPTHKGARLQDIKDVRGYAFGEEIMRAAKDGAVNEVTYLWPRPGSDTPIPTVMFFTKVADQICGVGYYK